MVKVIGIAGGSGSGKTTLARAVAKRLGADRCAIIAQDHYYIDQSARFDGDGGSVNFDHPSSIEFTLLARHLNALSRGQVVEIPRYDFASHTRKAETQRFDPRPFVLVEGTLILSQAVILPCLDVSIFIEASEAVRYQRRLDRDVRERGRTAEGVRRQFERQVKPMHDEFVEPSRSKAGLVVSGEIDIQVALGKIMAVVEE